MKKWLYGILALVMVAVTGCSGGKGNSSESPSPASDTKSSASPAASSASGASPAAGKFIELTAWSSIAPPQGLLISKASDTKVGLSIAKKSGVSFTVNYTQGDKEQNFNLRLASKDWEDVIWTDAINFDWTEKLLKAGAIIPLDKYFTQPDKYPNLAKIPKEVLDNYRYSDGHIYQFPAGWYEDPNSIYGYWAAAGWYVNPTTLAAVNMKAEDLTSLDAFENYLKAVKAAKLKDKNGNDIIPMSAGKELRFWKTVATAFGVSTAGNGFEQQANGSFLHYRDDPRLVQELTWLNKLNREGLLDAEIASQTDEQLQQKLTNQRVALVADEAWRFWGTVTAGKGPVTDLLKIKFPLAPGVTKLGVMDTYNPLGTTGAFVTTRSKNPDAVAKYADWSSEKGVSRGWEMYYGPYGEFWDWDPAAKKPNYVITDKELSDAQQKGDYKKMNELGFSSIVNLAPFDLDLNYFNKAAEPQLFWIFDMHKFYAPQQYIVKFKPYYNVKMPADGVWLKNFGTLAKLDTEYYAKLILAKSDDDFKKVWEQYQTQLEKQGNWSAAKAEWIATKK